jgi:hypothetical protein
MANQQVCLDDAAVSLIVSEKLQQYKNGSASMPTMLKLHIATSDSEVLIHETYWPMFATSPNLQLKWADWL